MPPTPDTPIPSKVAFKCHPLHPMLVVFPLAFTMSNPLTDLVFWWSGDAFWALVSFWLAAAALASGTVAALLGLADFMLFREPRRHVTGWSHFILAVMSLALVGANVQLRWDDPVGAVLPWGIVVSALAALVVAMAGWLGGTLTFHHGIGTYGEGRVDGESIDAADTEDRSG